MKIVVKTSWMVLAGMLCVSPSAGAGEKRPIVVVFNIEIQGPRLSRSARNNLSDYLTGKLAGSGVFQVVPRDQLKKRLLQQKKRSYKRCYDQNCQIDLGRELAAEKTLATKVLKIGSRCTVSTTLYDLKRATADSASSVTGGCKPDEIVKSIDRAVGELAGAPVETTSEPTAQEEPVAEAPADPPADTGSEEPEEEYEQDGPVGPVYDPGAWPVHSVQQPGTDLHWMRCAVGRKWNGKECEGSPKLVTWEEAPKACPKGYRVPSRKEMEELLGGCVTHPKSENQPNCNHCEKSNTCYSMYQDEAVYGYTWKNRNMWLADEHDSYSDCAWAMASSTSGVSIFYTSKWSEHDVLCVRVE